MLVSYDPMAEATYVTFDAETAVARTVALSDAVMVDVDDAGRPLGVEFLVLPRDIDDAMLGLVGDTFPSVKAVLLDRDLWLLAPH